MIAVTFQSFDGHFSIGKLGLDQALDFACVHGHEVSSPLLQKRLLVTSSCERLMVAWERNVADHPPVTDMCRATAGFLLGAVDDKKMYLGLTQDRLVDGVQQMRIVAAGAKRSSQIRRIILAEADVKGTRAGERHTIEAFAEVVRHWCDEAKTATGLRDFDVACRTAGLVGDVSQRPSIHQARTHDRER